MNDDPLSPEEEARLARARVFVTPPAGQDDRLVAALKERGLLRPRRRSTGVLTMVAAALVVALAWAAQQSGCGASKSPPPVRTSVTAAAS
jgi:hypothetical protein